MWPSSRREASTHGTAGCANIRLVSRQILRALSRPLAFGIALLRSSAAAAADGWREYVYPGLKFAVSFPAQPKVEDVDYKLSDGIGVKSRVYSLELDHKSNRRTVADFSRKNWDEFAMLDQAVKSLLQDAHLKLDLSCRFNLIYTCREMSIVRHDGSNATVAAMFYQHRLYQIEGTVLPANSDPESGDTVRFQHSLRFTDFAYQ